MKSNYSKGVLLITLTFFLIIVSAGCERQEEVAPEPVKNEFVDGTYTGFSDATDNGYAWARVTIEDDKITDVKLMEITSKGNEKDYETYSYEASVEAQQEMPDRFVEANSAKVDNYTGATHSSEKYKEAVSRALDYARGEEEDGKYYDGKFQGESERTEYGYAVALVTIVDDKMNNVELQELDGEGEWKDFDNYDYEPAVEANEEMAERFVEENSVAVDLYTEATQSSIRYKEAVENALRHARRDPAMDVEEAE
ncbi:FMN-binding protein [Halocella sp. SP3-1]|uniref:FMN-binding protein n=1 Tax=Halocella sp. SP3-1 TaxID=2382161 RepID=UPI000F751785|nr:FMN-binding protein [Halocella sp. SP3-1]AZO93887.1 FMN-binding protein [Halocella sp. SP3-1]